MGSSTSSLLLLVLVAGMAAAQEFPAPSDTGHVLTGPQRVQGQVVRPGAKEMLPVPGVWVTLHRVGNDVAAPLDSVRADASGRYEFNFRRTGDQEAVYFVSATYEGIAYFTPPLMHSIVLGEEAEIAVFDTTSLRVPISVRGRHVIVSAVNAASSRTVTEVYELANDSSVTRVSRPGSRGAVWTATVSSEATNFDVSQGDIPAGGITFEKGRALVHAPLAPGLKQVVFSYSLPASSFPLRVPVREFTSVLEVLIEEENGSVSGAQLKEVSPVSVESRSFRRFLAADVPANAVPVIDLPATAAGRGADPRVIAAIAVLVGAAMAFALARALRRR